MFHHLGVLFYAKARYAEAEPLMRRVIEISALQPVQDVSKVASSMGNLALLLTETNRVGEAESLLRQAIALDNPDWSDSSKSGHPP